MKEDAAADAPAAHRLRLGGCVLDLAAGELLAPGGQRAALRKQALELLLTLGRRAGEVVSKNELMDRVWPGVVVGESSLAQAVADIRRALGDSGHRLVRNIARRGYLLAPDGAPGADDDRPPLSIAVLPFEIEGEAGSVDWLAAALHGDLITELARLQGVVVIARDTAAAYQDRDVDPRQVARELHVRHVVRGRLRRDGTQLRLALVLVDGDRGVQIWAETFQVERARLPQALDELAVQVTRALQPDLLRSTVERRTALSALEVSADDLAMRAVAIWFRGLNFENVVEALKLLERAVALDRDSVRAWGGLNVITLQGVYQGWLTDRAARMQRIEEAAQQLERLDSDGYYTWQARTIRAFLREDWATMLRVSSAWCERCLHPAPFAARGIALIFNGRPDEALPALHDALRISPRDSMRAEWQYRIALAHFIVGRYELACEWGQTAAISNPGLPWPPVHAAAMQRLGQHEAAENALRDHLARHPGFEAAHILRRLSGGSAGFLEGRGRLLDSLREIGLS
jgi:TolB-like protein